MIGLPSCCFAFFCVFHKNRIIPAHVPCAGITTVASGNNDTASQSNAFVTRIMRILVKGGFWHYGKKANMALLFRADLPKENV
jgi:hypothetical protein